MRRYRQDRAEEHSFDHLARGLASGSVSRKQALKLVGGALLGGVLTSLPGVAWATHKAGHKQPPGLSPPPPPPPPPGSPPPPPPESPPPPPPESPPPPPPDQGCTPGQRCGSNGSCACIVTTEGTSFCTGSLLTICDVLTPCTSTADCPEGYACSPGHASGYCPSLVCFPPCGG